MQYLVVHLFRACGAGLEGGWDVGGGGGGAIKDLGDLIYCSSDKL